MKIYYSNLPRYTFFIMQYCKYVVVISLIQRELIKYFQYLFLCIYWSIVHWLSTNSFLIYFSRLTIEASCSTTYIIPFITTKCFSKTMHNYSKEFALLILFCCTWQYGRAITLLKSYSFNFSKHLL